MPDALLLPYISLPRKGVYLMFVAGMPQGEAGKSCKPLTAFP